ncbi:uncharacterized protein LOC131206154 isoform X1 [Anopheles bellator]|uniref:uncharacterized protein LOC131206154 isoform X1 n=1 Tax=Anopheles bellator TaxID=139047 RepID=UPI0026479042|nr:uncharacterized protein LOC131206154 isoform X1 [Anopheles bellator]XP_058054570.1 uncharacterized protein LOC131206154 isoform X1 [Anopheles bellator]
MLESMIMNRIFRYFMKFHGYFIAFCTIFFTSVIIVSSFMGREVRDEPLFVEEELVEAVQRFPVLIQLESALWLCASALLVAGLYRENKNFLTPFLALFIVDGVVVIVQETVNLCTGRPSELAMIETRQLVIMLLANVYVLVSLIVLYRMFGKGPLPVPQNNFVRFDNEQDVESGPAAAQAPPQTATAVHGVPAIGAT